MRKFNQIFPEDIISDILARLPAESVLECKSVCKTWKNHIQHPSFPQMHLNHLNRPDSADSGKLRYVFLKEKEDCAYIPRRLYYFEYNENEDWNYVKPIPRKIMFTFGLVASIVLGSFNGLICIYRYQYLCKSDGRPAIILNPVTREYIVLPGFYKYPEYETKRYAWIKFRAFGFGYLASTNEYKVVRIYISMGEPTVVEVEVYTVGSGKGWRHVGKFDFGFRFHPHCRQPHGVFLNGCLHWKSIFGVIVVFDLADEKFRDHIAPPIDDDDNDDLRVLGVSGGILYYAVCQIFKGRAYDDVWLYMKKNDNHVMKEHEGHQSWGWSKVTSLEQREPFAFTVDGTVLRFDQGIFLSTTSTSENYTHFSGISRQVFPHKNTFVSLKELGELDAKIMKFESGVEDSSESGSD